MMSKRLSEKWAKINIMMIGMFYVYSGIWVWMLGAYGEKGISFGDSIFSDIYSLYAVIIGFISAIIGILLMLELNFSRVIAFALAWWNLFISPAIEVFWNIYSMNTEGASQITSEFGLWLYSAIIILVMTAIRLYSIYMLRPSKAGYIFLKKESSPIKKGS